jgi:hypothetical protein
VKNAVAVWIGGMNFDLILISLLCLKTGLTAVPGRSEIRSSPRRTSMSRVPKRFSCLGKWRLAPDVDDEEGASDVKALTKVKKIMIAARVGFAATTRRKHYCMFIL